jgi:hypothetical protein
VVHDLLLILVVLAALRLVLGVGHRAAYPRRVARVRRFTLPQYGVIVNRAGRRCEHHSLIFGRCRAVERLEADHIHPYARGGQTALENGQALCHFHNTLKGASVPFFWDVWLLERRRRRYFPPGSEVGVVRFGSRESTKIRRRRRRRRPRRYF